jgi:hypothetical protein
MIRNGESREAEKLFFNVIVSLQAFYLSFFLCFVVLPASRIALHCKNRLSQAFA